MSENQLLTTDLASRLNKSPLISVLTVDPETLQTQINAVSWIRAHDGTQTIRIAVGHQSECLANIEKGSPVTLGWIDQKDYYMIKGPITVSDMKKGTMKYRIIELKVKSLENVMFYGGEVVQIPTYRKTYDPELAKKIDQEIEQALEEGWTQPQM